MLRLHRKYFSKQSIPDLYRNVRRNTSPEPGFSGNDFTYFKELNEAIRSTKPLWSKEFYENKLGIRSKDLLYWPRTEVIFKSVDEGTVVSIKFLGAIFGNILYGLFILAFLTGISVGIYHNPNDAEELIIAFVVFSIPISLIPFWFRKTQNKILQLIEYS